LITLDHHWAFGLFARHWRAMQPELADFYDVVAGTDYSRRDHRAIYSRYARLDVAPRATSQDAAKALACDRLGFWRCNAKAPFANYIGACGQHMTPELYNEIGFERAAVLTEPVDDLRFPDAGAIDAALADQRRLFQDIRSNEFAAIERGLPPRNYNPNRRCDREDVWYGYRLLLGREPESDYVYADHVGSRHICEFVKGLADSLEFDSLAASPARLTCTREDVTYAYRLLLHRDPEDESIYREHVGKTDTRDLTLAIWRDPARSALWSVFEAF
jgi:hypothetical protein